MRGNLFNPGKAIRKIAPTKSKPQGKITNCQNNPHNGPSDSINITVNNRFGFEIKYLATKMTPTIPEHYFLYADDDPDDQFFFREMVQKFNSEYSVIEVHQGLELMQFLQELQPGDHLPCCIVLDINMPIWDGIRTLRELKANAKFSSIPVVMFTTSTSARDTVVCKELGADHFISKPATQVELEETIQIFTGYCSATLSGR